ncbi:MAG: hypothetical protein U0931_35170 [Vulcanimicrobiota bacterium]
MKKTLLTVAAASFLFVLAGCSENNPPAATGSPAPGTSGGVVITATPVVSGTPMAPGTATMTPGTAPGTETPMGTATPGMETPAAPGTETPAATATP